MKLLEIKGEGHVPQCPIASDATEGEGRNYTLGIRNYE